MDKNKTSDKNSKDDNDYLKWSNIGLEFGGVIAVFCYIGYKIDAVLNSSPYFLLGGFFAGFIGMFYLIYKQMNNKK
ncbi:MAG: AtpZ/AtpI family protein [Planctomycetaceae bacterium]|nr:AtpZ/AtpI family protein [Planctomycetaceae bacterium]